MQHRTHPLPSPVPGTHRVLESFHFGPDDAETSVYVQAALHADELPGMLVAWKLKQRLAELEATQLLRARVVLVPVANPIGLDQQLMDTPLGRYDLESIRNFNRHYFIATDAIAEGLEAELSQDPEHNKAVIRRRFQAALEAQPATASYDALHRTQQRLACDADYILDLHCDFEAVEHLYTTPAAWPDFEPLARYFGSKASMLATDSGGASFDECFSLVWEQLRERFGEHYPIPNGSKAMTLELRGQQDVNFDMAEKDSEAILNWMTHQALIEGDSPELPELAYPATDLAAMEFLYAPVGGLVVFHATPGEVVTAGTMIAEIIDPISDSVHPLCTQHGGMFYARNQRRMATAGMIVADIAGQHVHRSGYLLAP